VFVIALLLQLLGLVYEIWFTD